jgi:CheY-like chemotaxis protein
LHQNEEEECACPKILIVDDNDFNILSLKTILEINHHLQTDQAYNGEQALKLVQDRMNSTTCPLKEIRPNIKHVKAYKLVFMDIAMPVMDGFSAAKKIRELEQTLN